MVQTITELPDGEYAAEIVDIIEEMTSQGYPKISWILKIIGGQYNGALIEKKYYLKNDKSKNFLKKELHLIGFEIANSDEFGAAK